MHPLSLTSFTFEIRFRRPILTVRVLEGLPTFFDKLEPFLLAASAIFVF
jgi:hypothetical protein